MSEYTNKQQAIDLIESMIADRGHAFNPHKLAMALKDMEGVEIVHCKNCEFCVVEEPISRGIIPDMYCRIWASNVRTDDYCSYGERKEKVQLFQETPTNSKTETVDTITRENDPEVPKYTTEWASSSDLISRQAAIEALCQECVPVGECGADCPEVEILRKLPPVEPKIYGNEHNCIMTMFGECSYSETGCGSCAVVQKVRNALKDECPQAESERPTGEWVGEGDGYADGGIVYDTWYCSKCDHCEEGEELALPNFCPNCGCQMERAV